MPESAEAPESPPEPPSSPELPLPSLASLTKASGISLVGAIVLLVLVVLPAEYNVDPTGFGQASGLTQLSAPADDDVVDARLVESPPAEREDSVVVEVPPGGSVEYKFWLRAGAKMRFSWESDSGPIRYDLHGEVMRGEEEFYESFTKSTSQKTRGTFTAPFEGTHGWWWKNKTPKVVKITLETSGTYRVLGLR